MRSSASGFGYDLKNIIDLMRYLFPLPVPQRWRRHMLALGSGDPTRHHLLGAHRAGVRVGALSDPAQGDADRERVARQELLEIRHSSLYTPRDFDISPYFAVVKPTC